MARSRLGPDDYANIGRLMTNAGLAEWMWREWFRKCLTAQLGVRVDEMEYAKQSRSAMVKQLNGWTLGRLESQEAKEALACSRELGQLLTTYRDPLAHCAAIPVSHESAELEFALFHLGKRCEIEFLDELPNINRRLIALATHIYNLGILPWLATTDRIKG